MGLLTATDAARAEAADRLTVKVAFAVPVAGSLTVTSLIEMSGRTAASVAAGRASLVADAAHRHDDLGVLGVVLDLRAQPLDVDVDEPGVGGVAVAPPQLLRIMSIRGSRSERSGTHSPKGTMPRLM